MRHIMRHVHEHERGCCTSPNQCVSHFDQKSCVSELPCRAAMEVVLHWPRVWGWLPGRPLPAPPPGPQWGHGGPPSEVNSDIGFGSDDRAPPVPPVLLNKLHCMASAAIIAHNRPPAPPVPPAAIIAWLRPPAPPAPAPAAVVWERFADPSKLGAVWWSLPGSGFLTWSNEPNIPDRHFFEDPRLGGEQHWRFSVRGLFAVWENTITQ